jgi:hypothetical protein
MVPGFVLNKGNTIKSSGTLKEYASAHSKSF